VPTNPTLRERNARDEAVMAELRANRGRTAAGQTLVILTVTGSRTGTRRDKPVCVREDGDDLVVAGSAGGQARHPQWYLNLVSNPELTVEYRGEIYRAVADTVANSVDRDRLFQMMSEEITGLYGYQDRCRDSRQIPVVRIRRR
jgi:deazaflavin-dependent oxidoreductase (nitroreductase family)